MLLVWVWGAKCGCVGTWQGLVELYKASREALYGCEVQVRRSEVCM